MTQLNNIDVSDAMLDEENRFRSYPENWESTHPDLPTRIKLAAAGFFYEVIPSAVNIEFACAFCGIKVGTLHWQRGEDANEGHKRINRSCPFYDPESKIIVSNVFIP